MLDHILKEQKREKENDGCTKNGLGLQRQHMLKGAAALAVTLWLQRPRPAYAQKLTFTDYPSGLRVADVDVGAGELATF